MSNHTVYSIQVPGSHFPLCIPMIWLWPPLPIARAYTSLSILHPKKGKFEKYMYMNAKTRHKWRNQLWHLCRIVICNKSIPKWKWCDTEGCNVVTIVMHLHLRSQEPIKVKGEKVPTFFSLLLWAPDGAYWWSNYNWWALMCWEWQNQ